MIGSGLRGSAVDFRCILQVHADIVSISPEVLEIETVVCFAGCDALLVIVIPVDHKPHG